MVPDCYTQSGHRIRFDWGPEGADAVGPVLAASGVERLVLPSPNGSTVAARLAATGATVVGVSLRNAGAAAAWVRRRAGDRPVAVIAAGERWNDGPLRPAVEDLWGAGAFIAALAGDGASPEARAAAAAYRDIAADVPGALAGCASGRELIGDGYPGDVEVAGERTDSPAVPVLSGGWFTDRGAGSHGVADRMSGAPRDTCEETP